MEGSGLLQRQVKQEEMNIRAGNPSSGEAEQGVW
jgi:hypothetical protein